MAASVFDPLTCLIPEEELKGQYDRARYRVDELKGGGDEVRFLEALLNLAEVENMMCRNTLDFGSRAEARRVQKDLTAHLKAIARKLSFLAQETA